jgi:Zn-dependent peptidase ImmA (M78 family)
LPVDLHVPTNAIRQDIEDRANELRHRWKIENGPIVNMVRLLEVNGVIVTHCIFDCREMSSFSRWFDSRPIVVLKEERDDLARLRSDAAHELGHLVLHERHEPANQILEEQAQAFAASFLAPAEQIRPTLPKSFDIGRYAELKRVWGVSIAALLYRSRELGKMSESTYRRAMMTISKNGWRFHEPFPLTGRESTQLLDRVFEVIQKNGVAVPELLRQSRLPANFLSQVTPERDLEEIVL